MENKEKIEVLMKKANISYEEAEKILKENNWDVLDALLALERKGKAYNNEEKAIIKVKEEKKEESFGGVGELIGRIFKFLGKFIKKGNENYFEIRKNEEKPIRISLTVSALILIFLSVPAIILLIVGLFCGYKYSLAGKKINYEGVNSVFEGVSKSASSVKEDFKKGYEA